MNSSSSSSFGRSSSGALLILRPKGIVECSQTQICEHVQRVHGLYELVQLLILEAFQ